MIISLISCVGSPGVTSTSVGLLHALAEVRGEREVVLVEVDTSGGVISTQYEMSPDKGLVSLAVHLGPHSERPDLFEHAQPLPDRGLPVLLAPPSSRSVTSLLADKAEALGSYLSSASVEVILDCGRVTSSSPVVPLLAKSGLICVAVNPTREHLGLTANTLAEIEQAAGHRLPFAVILTAKSGYTIAEISNLLRCDVVAEIPYDERNLAALAGRMKLRNRGPLMRSLNELAEQIVVTVSPAPTTEPLPSPPHSPTATQINGGAFPSSAVSETIVLP